MGHIHAVLYPFVVFTSVKLAPLIFGSGIRARSGILDIFKFPCRRTGRVDRFRGSSISCAAGGVDGSLLVLGKFVFKVCSQSNWNLVVVSTLVVPFSGRLLVSIQVYHVGNEGTGVESGEIFHPLYALAIDVGK